MENGNWEKSVLEKVLLESVKEQRRSRRWKIFFRLIILGLIIWGIFKYYSNKDGDIIHEDKHVAVVDLVGEISDEQNTYDNVKDSLNAALEDKNTIAVIIRANSPGGSPVYSSMLYDEIMRLKTKYPKIPIDVVVEEMCASGCYWIASAATKIYASGGSIVGSIGVIYRGFGLTGSMQKLGVDSRLVIAGKNKAMGYPFIPENAEQTQMQQQMLDQIHQDFIRAVKKGRGSHLFTDAPDLFSGRYWIGDQAINLGLIDGFATVDSLARDQFKTENIVDYTTEDDTLDKISKKLGVGLSDFAQKVSGMKSLGKFY